MSKTFLIRRKDNGDVLGPVTTEQANDIAGYPEEFEKVETAKAVTAGYDGKNGPDDVALAAPRAPRATKARNSKARTTASKAAPAPAPAPAPAGDTTTNEG